jgi:ribosomal protein S18 acetylase RimI-like enzyme
MNPVTIRPATDDDAHHVIVFNTALAAETEGKTLDASTLAVGVRKALADPARSLYFLAEVDGAVVGQTMVTFEWSDWRNAFFWWIQSVYVDSRFRRRGVFRALHDHVRREARSRPDVCGLRLYVHHDNHRAMKTYQRLGMPQGDYLMCEEDWSGAERGGDPRTF